MARSVTASAPGKIMLLGEHAVVYGCPCIVTAVDQRMRATVSEREDNLFCLHAPDVKIDAYEKPMKELGRGDIPRGAAFVEQAVKNFCEASGWEKGVTVETLSEFSSQFGFGSSSASTVAVLRALAELSGRVPEPKELFDLAYKTVLDVQGKGSGFDVAVAVWGGTLWFVKGASELRSLASIDAAIVVGYTGVKADTVMLMDAVRSRSEENPELVEGVYDSIRDLVVAAGEAMAVRDWKMLGSLMDINQGLLASLGVSTPQLEAMIAAARDAGAFGAKLSGAGGGDCMIALVPRGKEQAVKDAIAEAGGQPLDVAVHALGVQVE